MLTGRVHVESRNTDCLIFFLSGLFCVQSTFFFFFLSRESQSCVSNTLTRCSIIGGKGSAVVRFEELIENSSGPGSAPHLCPHDKMFVISVIVKNDLPKY